MNFQAVVIHDEPGLRQLIAEFLEAWTRYSFKVETTSFSNRLSGPMRRWLVETDFFIIGLERHYREGRCAEGVDTGKMLLSLGKKVLIVGSECSSDQLNLPFYWDMADSRSLLEAVAEVIDSPLPGNESYRTLELHFMNRSAKPVGHR